MFNVPLETIVKQDESSLYEVSGFLTADITEMVVIWVLDWSFLRLAVHECVVIAFNALRGVKEDGVWNWLLISIWKAWGCVMLNTVTIALSGFR